MGRASDFTGFEMMKEQLSGEYREAFEAVLSYGTVKNISQDILTERLTELYDTLLTAQSEGREARRVVGEDRQRFCRDVFQDYTFWESVKNLFIGNLTPAGTILALELFHLIASGDQWRELRINVLPYLVGLGCGTLLILFGMLVVAPLMLRYKKINPSSWKKTYYVAISVTTVASIFVVLKLPLPQWELPSWWIALAAAIYIILILIIRMRWRYKNYGTLRNIRKEMRRDSYYKELDDAKNEIMWLNTWKKRYERLTRKGKNSPEDALRKLKRELRLSSVYEKGGWLFAAAMVLPGIIQRIINGASDLVLYTLWRGGIMFLVMRFLTKQYRRGDAVLKQVIESCEESGLSLPEVIEERLSPKTMGSDAEDQDDSSV